MNTEPAPHSRRPSAGWLVGCAVLLGIGSLLAWFALVPPSRADLRFIEGIITRISDSSATTKTVTVIQEQILVQDGARVFQLRHDYLSQLRGLVAGQKVSALVEPDPRGFFWVWELRLEDNLLLTYEQSLARHTHSGRFILAIAVVCVLCALAGATRYAQLRSRVVAHAA